MPSLGLPYCHFSGKCLFRGQQWTKCVHFTCNYEVYQKQLNSNNQELLFLPTGSNLLVLRFKYWRDPKIEHHTFRNTTRLYYISKGWEQGYSIQALPRNILNATVLALFYTFRTHYFNPYYPSNPAPTHFSPLTGVVSPNCPWVANCQLLNQIQDTLTKWFTLRNLAVNDKTSPQRMLTDSFNSNN